MISLLTRDTFRFFFAFRRISIMIQKGECLIITAILKKNCVEYRTMRSDDKKKANISKIRKSKLVQDSSISLTFCKYFIRFSNSS